MAADVGGLSAEQINAALARKADKTGTIYYIGGTLATPDTTGFPTLAAYLHDMYRKGYRGICGPVGNFEDLDVKQWGYGVLATPGESGSVWDVEIFRSLSSTRQYRQLNADSGGWIMDDWEEYATKTDLLNKANVTEALRAFYNSDYGNTPYGPNAATWPQCVASTTAGTQNVPGDGWGTFVRLGVHRPIDFFYPWNMGGLYLQLNGGGYIPLATATPPEEHDLPLAEGWTAGRKTKFSVSQDSLVLVTFGVWGPANTSDRAVIAQLPPSFRPGELISTGCTVTDESTYTRYAAGLDVNRAGEVIVFSKQPGWSIAVGQVAFYTNV